MMRSCPTGCGRNVEADRYVCVKCWISIPKACRDKARAVLATAEAAGHLLYRRRLAAVRYLCWLARAVRAGRISK